MFWNRKTLSKRHALHEIAITLHRINANHLALCHLVSESVKLQKATFELAEKRGDGVSAAVAESQEMTNNFLQPLLDLLANKMNGSPTIETIPAMAGKEG